TGKTWRLLEQVRTKLGLVPNLFRVLANAPVALEGYLDFSAALAGGTLDNRIREQIALAVAESNLCRYCRSAHVFRGKKAGLATEEIAKAIRAGASDLRIDAVLKLTRTINVQRGEVSDSELQRARAAGLTDGELVETVANIALNISPTTLITSHERNRLPEMTAGAAYAGLRTRQSFPDFVGG